MRSSLRDSREPRPRVHPAIQQKVIEAVLGDYVEEEEDQVTPQGFDLLTSPPRDTALDQLDRLMEGAL